MTENKEKDKDKSQEKDKDKEKDHERGGFLNIVDVVSRKTRERCSSTFSEEFKFYKGSGVSIESVEIITVVLETGQIGKVRHLAKDDQIGTQRVYKKTSANSVLTLYLPTRELISCGSSPAILKGILFVDPKMIQGYRVYAQLTLTFRYGREDEEVMGLRFCNEAIMSLHQVWPRGEEASKEALTPLQDALVKRLGEGALPFTLSLTPQAPPSVQLVPAKRYYGAPIGTSYDVRCFIADKTDEKFHRRASVKMGIRVIHRTDVLSTSGPENFAALMNNQMSPPPQDGGPNSLPASTSNIPNTCSNATPPCITATTTTTSTAAGITTETQGTQTSGTGGSGKVKKSERVDSFPKIRLSPKSFRFSSRFGRSKSEVEKGPSDPFYSYSKSFQEYESGGPQGAVDKPFLLQEGRVGLRASLDKSWYAHGEDVIVTVNIKNDSRKTVRRMRVCAIQHVDVCMFNNGKFKNVVADSDMNSPSGNDRIVGPGGTLNATIILKPQRGPTKNWIALEDSLQRSSEPDEITGVIAASAVRTPTVNPLGNVSGTEDRNVFAIYVSYYVKVKLTLSGMGGELSLKLPFALVHIDQSNKSGGCNGETASVLKDLELSEDIKKLTLMEPSGRNNKNTSPPAPLPDSGTTDEQETTNSVLDKIESIEETVEVTRTEGRSSTKRKLIRHETMVKDFSSDDEAIEETMVSSKPLEVPKSENNEVEIATESGAGSGNNHNVMACVQVHAPSS